jgi:FXSXX-COOH protein
MVPREQHVLGTAGAAAETWGRHGAAATVATLGRRCAPRDGVGKHVQIYRLDRYFVGGCVSLGSCSLRPGDIQGAHMSEDAAGHDDGLIDVSEFTLRQLANEVDESSLTWTLRRLLSSSEGGGEVIAGWGSCLSRHPSGPTG